MSVTCLCNKPHSDKAAKDGSQLRTDDIRREKGKNSSRSADTQEVLTGRLQLQQKHVHGW